MYTICNHCQKPIESNAKFCQHCGKANSRNSTLKECGGCKGLVSSEAIFCHNCGKDLAELKDEQAHPFICKKCGSENVTRLSIAHAQGLQNLTLSTTGGGIGIGSNGVGIGIGSAETRGSAQTLLSEKVSPPIKSDLPYKLFGTTAILIVMACFGYSSGDGDHTVAHLMVMNAIFLFICGLVINHQNKKLEPEIFKWGFKFICLKCGEISLLEHEYQKAVNSSECNPLIKDHRQRF
ncbi:zinc ribbon domain-containing protein [Geomonas limicola]|uniref:zinc ribbon domain-containing protein n=1 Tax=Geomonas limicola TaxID=2740186 RepID=UPI0016107786|nr:zinc ribbon domain-containing protein [Geomonas limicola]